MRTQNDFNEKGFHLVNIGDATFCFSGCELLGERCAEHLVQSDRPSARGHSCWDPCAPESRQAVDRARPRFNGDEHGDPSLRYYNHAQDTCVRNAPHAVSVEL
jgi:hypothetical protein